MSGSYIPGPGRRFRTDAAAVFDAVRPRSQLQFVSTINWKEGERFRDKVIYYNRTIGDCYQVQILYSEASRLVSVALNLLSFPSQAATFGIGQAGPIVPTTFNF